MKNSRKRYHHIGIPSNEIREGETYLERFKMHVSGYETGEHGIEWMRFEPESPMPELVRTVAHVAFEVPDLEDAIAGREILIEPNSPSEGVRAAFVVENGAPVEFLEIDPAAAGAGERGAGAEDETGPVSESIALAFVEAINAGSVDRLSELMTDEHAFVDCDGKEHAGRERMREGWREYFTLVPDYRIHVRETFARGDTVVLLGIAEGTFRRVAGISFLDAQRADGATSEAEISGAPPEAGTAGDGEALDPENHWSVPATWRAVVDGERVALWQLYVNPEPMREILKRMGLA